MRLARKKRGRTRVNKVEIPQSLIDKLVPFGPRYLKVAAPILGDDKSGKKAVEHAWPEHLYNADDPELQAWLEAGNNYGVAFGEGVIGVDLDDAELRRKFKEKVNTLEVKSGRADGSGLHAYCRSDATENGSISDEHNKNLGNIQVHHKYVVGPNSNHFSGRTYKIVNDAPLAWVPKKLLEEIFGEQLKWAGESQKENEDEAGAEKELIDFEIPIKEIIPNFEELHQIGNDEFQGEHPVHGSTTAQNFCVSISKNCWHCFRCNSGGGPLMWLAVQHGLIRCDQAQKGVLRGDLFLKALELARKEGYDIEPSIDEEIEPDVAKYFEGKPPRFIPAYLAEDTMKKFHYVTRESDEIIFLYHPDRGVYTPNGEAHVKAQIKKALGKHLRKNRQNEVINYIVCSTLQRIEETPPNLIALKNGIFDLKTKLLKPFDPGYFILNGLPIVYDPKADCSEIKKFIGEVVHSEDVQVLQETSGYSLWRAYPLHKAIMLVGEGANGKSTFLELLRTMLGRENVSTIPLHDLETSSFARSSLYGKLANIYPDLSDRALRSTGYFKMLSGGDTISAEYKFHDRFEFKNYAKLIFSCNKVPESPDDTTAFFRRWIIINFPKQFLEGDPKTDSNILERLTTEEELSGFFNWAVEGLERLLKNGKFSTGKSVEETREQYIRASDPVKAFAMDCIQPKAGSVVSKDEVYKAFLDYCQEMKLPTCPKNIFAMKLSQHVPNIQSEIKRMGKQRVQCWRDIALVTKDVSGMARMADGIYNCTTIEDDSNNRDKEKLIEKPLATPANPDAGMTLEDFDDVVEREDARLDDEQEVDQG